MQSVVFYSAHSTTRLGINTLLYLCIVIGSRNKIKPDDSIEL